MTEVSVFLFIADVVPIGYGINKLKLICDVEDEKISIDDLCEEILLFEDYVQSVEVVSMSSISKWHIMAHVARDVSYRLESTSADRAQPQVFPSTSHFKALKAPFRESFKCSLRKRFSFFMS